jgi:hypothetical protein
MDNNLNDKKLLEEGDDLLNDIISLNLNDENNFLTLEETTFPRLPNSNKLIPQFRVFRNTLAKIKDLLQLQTHQQLKN